MRHNSPIRCNAIHCSMYLESIKLNHSIGKAAAFAEDQNIFAGCLCAGRVSGRKEICDMVGTNCRIKLFRLVKPGHTALRTARGRQSRKYRDAQVRQVRKDEKPPPTVPDPLPGLLNVALEQIADSILLCKSGKSLLYCNFPAGCRDPPN